MDRVALFERFFGLLGLSKPGYDGGSVTVRAAEVPDQRSLKLRALNQSPRPSLVAQSSKRHTWVYGVALSRGN